MTGFTGIRPILMVMGGSLGSVCVNNAVRGILPELTKTFDVIHLCGKNNLDPELDGTAGYVQYEYISDELKDLFAAADCMISRAGANAICELIAMRKPNVLIPLSAAASRGDQLLNAESFRKQGFSEVLQEEELVGDALLVAVMKVWEGKETYIKAMDASPLRNGAEAVVNVINEVAGTAAR
jgi:UDP-N-acetylglucosamine--N-acetylmuramyl-(pentapeptide) pyrophosphoryl-undecaprenol N-acetylglucosamine transferase